MPAQVLKMAKYGAYRMRAALVMACLFCVDVFSAECSWPLPNQDQTENVWPYLSNISIGGIFADSVTLRAGQYEGLPFAPGGHARPQLRLWPELLISADLDDKAGDEKIGLLSETSGGSGERVYLIVATYEQGTYHALPAGLLGDRVKVRSMQVRDRQIMLQIIEAGPSQPMCCGTQLAEMNWHLQDGQLVPMDHRVQGELSLETLQGKQWYLLDRPGDRINAMHPSCTRLHLQGDQINLEVNGRLYTALINETSPGNVAIANIRPDLGNSAEPDERLVSQLMAVSQYSFRAGRLLLSGNAKERWLSFEFVALPEGN